MFKNAYTVISYPQVSKGSWLAMKALAEQLVVTLCVRFLRTQTIKLLKMAPKKFGLEEKEKKAHQASSISRLGGAARHVAFSTVVAYADGRICRLIPNVLVRRVVSAFMLSLIDS